MSQVTGLMAGLMAGTAAGVAGLVARLLSCAAVLSLGQWVLLSAPSAARAASARQLGGMYGAGASAGVVPAGLDEAGKVATELLGLRERGGM